MPRFIALPAALGHDRSDKRIAVLREIGAKGSISQAARAVGLSYKAAWQALGTLTTLAGVPLVTRVVGGAGGGGAVLTPSGRDLLKAAQAMEDARGVLLSGCASSAKPPGAVTPLAVQTSMRNQVPCMVGSLQQEGAIARVFLNFWLPLQQGGASAARVTKATHESRPALPHTAKAPAQAALVARITRKSAELLVLQPGVHLHALCKATAVHITRRTSDAVPSPAIATMGLPSDCLLPARATRVMRGALGDEVTADLLWAGRATGLRMVGFAEAHSRLRAGSLVTLRIEENSLVLASANHGQSPKASTPA